MDWRDDSLSAASGCSSAPLKQNNNNKTARKPHQSVTAIVSRFVGSSQNHFGRRGRRMKMKQHECVGRSTPRRRSIRRVRRRENCVSAVIPGPRSGQSWGVVGESPHGRAEASQRNNQEKAGFHSGLGRRRSRTLSAWNRQQVCC